MHGNCTFCFQALHCDYCNTVAHVVADVITPLIGGAQVVGMTQAALQRGLQKALVKLHRVLEGKRLRPWKTRRAVSEARASFNMWNWLHHAA